MYTSSDTSTLLTMMGRTRIRNGQEIMYGDAVGLAYTTQKRHFVSHLYISEGTHISFLIHTCWILDVPLVYGSSGNPFGLIPWPYAYRVIHMGLMSSKS